MKHLSTRCSFIGGAFALLFLAAGCASHQQAGQSVPDMLIASGFQSRTPDSAQQRKLQAIPAGQISQIDAYGKTFYVYPDWPGNRVLIGGPLQYQAYQQLRTSRNLPAENPAKVVHGPSFDWRQWYSGA
jgi:hypothetical protein